ncbi:hypothetical protein C0Q70_12596 [Pomacea canaliculata]|uniref:DUF4795 domain-containing protein n=1 Tax=Pomacea canaliculata TaxID=400727 RepID=A0A2T7P1Y5_POMCA|nr:hypothetical protein C0Q70_12596 [Pomacea canaliculata]
MHVFIDIFRLNELTPRALVDFLCALNDCGLTPEPLMHLLRMLSNSTSITTAGVHELLSFLEHTDLLHEDVFQELQEVANSCQLLVPSIITELMKLLKDANFTTLEDLCNAMQRLNFVSKDELDGHLRQMTHKHTQQMQILVTSCVLKEPEEEVLSRLAGVNEQPTPSSIPDVAEQQRLPPEAVSILESKVAEVQANQTAILDILTPKGRPLDPQSPRRYRSDVTLPNIFPPHPSRYPVIRIVADKSVETEDEVKVSDSGRVESEAVNMLLEERKCHEQKIQLLEDAIKELQKKKADRKDLNQAKDTNHQQADLLRRFMKLSTINESHEEKIKSIIQRQDSQEALFVSEQEKVLQDLDKMATKTELQDFRHGIREEVISAVYQDILRDSSVGCTKRPLKLNCLSCDRKLICLPESPYSQMPALPGFPPARPERPHTVFELNMVRRHARSLLEPPNMLTVDFYALPRQAGGIQTEYVHKEWSRDPGDGSQAFCSAEWQEEVRRLVAGTESDVAHLAQEHHLLDVGWEDVCGVG